jgi:hypothetical protein
VAACGWCLAFNDECCGGRFAWCDHGSRCDVALNVKLKYSDLGKTWCYEHGREDWCANKAKRKEGVDMSKVIEDANEILDEQVRKVLAGDPSGDSAMKARGMVEAMSVFLNRPADDLAREAVARVKAAS